ncbi:multidrug and toxin extrusion protein 1-like isoform X2 [Dysidea avara]|uniref:multidrug and toxin extrusion protein 1-like isoform X2 n=1 Tax=Dysidea avara TaxID=196820 RepID=UPI003319CBEF
MTSRSGLLVHGLQRVWKEWIRQEAVVLFSLSWPVCLTFFLQTLISFTALLFLGHLSESRSKLLLDGASLGSSFMSLCGFTTLIGLSSATETLCSQAYGAGNYRRVGVVLQRSLLICFLALFPVASLLLNAESILLTLHQSPCVAKLASIYCKFSIMRLMILCVQLLVMRYLQTQGVVKPMAGAAVIGNLVNVTSLSLLLLVAGLEIKGAVLSIVIAMFAMTTCFLLYIKIRGIHKTTWKGWSWDCLDEWGMFLKLAIPGTITIAAEISNFEIGAFVTGSVNETQQAAYIIMFNIAVMCYMVPLSISIAVGIRVGNMLGAGEPSKAKRSAVVAVCIASVWSLIEIVTMLSYRNIGELFTSDREVIDQVGHLTFVMSVFLPVDTIQAVLGGVLRGCGKQFATAITNVVSFHLIGVPISLTLVYAVDMGALGYMLGSAVGSITQLTLEVILVVCINWKKQSHKARINAGVTGDLKGTGDEQVTTTTDDDDEMVTMTTDDGQMTTDDGSTDDDSHVGDDVEIKQLLSEEKATKIVNDTSHIRRVLTRLPWLIVAVITLLLGVILSQYHIHPSYEPSCNDTEPVDNVTIHNREQYLHFTR